MEITVNTETVSGMDRGGENLFLVIQAKNENIKDRRLIAKLNNLDEAIDDFIKTITSKTADKDEIIDMFPPYGVLASDGKDVFCLPTEYGFKVDMTIETFTDLIKTHLNNKENQRNWTLSRGLNMAWFEWTYRSTHLVEGNAE